MLRKQNLYNCSHLEVWRRQIGELSPTSVARRIGGSQDFIKRLELYANLESHTGCVNTVHFNPSGDLLFSGSDDRQIIVWDWAARTKRLSYMSGHENNVFQAKAMPFSDDRDVVSCAADGQVRHGQITEGGRVETRKLAKHNGRAHKLAIEPGSPRIFYSCGEDGVVRHFDIRCRKNSKLFTCTSFTNGSSTSSRPPSVVRLNAIVLNPRNPHYFAVGGSDEYARVYDIRKTLANTSDCPVDTFSPHHLIGSAHVHITCVAYSLQEEILVSYTDENIYLFDRSMGLVSNPKLKAVEDCKTEHDKGLEVYKGHRNAQTVKGVNFMGPNTEYVVSGSDCGRIFIWKKKGGELVTLMTGDAQVVNCLEPHPCITVLATSGLDSDIKIWTPTAKKVRPLPSDVEEIMETNKRAREEEAPFALTPDVIMHLLRLHRRRAQRQHTQAQSSREGADMDHNVGNLHNAIYEDENKTGEDDGSSSDGSCESSQECIIS